MELIVENIQDVKHRFFLIKRNLVKANSICKSESHIDYVSLTLFVLDIHTNTAFNAVEIYLHTEVVVIVYCGTRKFNYKLKHMAPKFNCFPFLKMNSCIVYPLVS